MYKRSKVVVVSLLAEAGVFVEAKRHKLTMKYVHFLQITNL
jgi:hypothetical protein